MQQTVSARLARWALCLAVLAGVSLSGCGGSDQYVDQLAPADAAAEQAFQLRQIVVTGPCSSDAQCGSLSLMGSATSCGGNTQWAYLLSAPDAAAMRAMASNQQAFMAAHNAQLPLSAVAVCPAYIAKPQVPRCVYRQCQMVAE